MQACAWCIAKKKSPLLNEFVAVFKNLVVMPNRVLAQL